MASFRPTTWAQKNSYGVVVDASVSGNVAIVVQGLDGPGTVIASGAGSAVVTPGQTSAPVMITLTPITSGSGGQGGTAAGSGGAGATGGMASAGSGGAAGGAPGSGAMVGTGTGGVAGSGGTASGGTGNAGGNGAGGMGTGGKSGRAWQGASLAETNNPVEDYVPVLAADANGNAVAVYIHGATVASSYYDVTKGTWGAESVIDTRSMSDAANVPAVGVDKNGNWLAVWQQDPSTPLRGIWQSTSTDGVHWAAPAAIATTNNLFEPVLGMGPDGTAIVAWTDTSGGNYTLTGSARVGGAWTAPHVLLAGTDNGERNEMVAVTSTGTGIVTWEQSDGTANDELSVWQARFSNGAWAAASLVENYDAGEAYSATVATNNVGQAILGWIEVTSATAQLWAQRYPATGAPEAPMLVAEGTEIGESPAPSVTLDDSGTATFAWAFAVKQKFNVYTNRTAWGQAWPSTSMAMETDDDAAMDSDDDRYAFVTNPLVAHDASGNVALIWKKRVGATRFDMWARNYDAASSTWSPGVLLETMDAQSVIAPALAMSPNGVAVAAWYYTSEYEIWANVYR